MANVQNIIYLFDCHKNDGNNKDWFYYSAAPRCFTCQEKKKPASVLTILYLFYLTNSNNNDLEQDNMFIDWLSRAGFTYIVAC